MFPIETLLKMIDSNVRSHGEIKYDNQNSLQHQKPPVSAISCEPCESTENSWEPPWSLVLRTHTRNHCALVLALGTILHLYRTFSPNTGGLKVR